MDAKPGYLQEAICDSFQFVRELRPLRLLGVALVLKRPGSLKLNHSRVLCWPIITPAQETLGT